MLREVAPGVRFVDFKTKLIAAESPRLEAAKILARRYEGNLCDALHDSSSLVVLRHRFLPVVVGAVKMGDRVGAFMSPHSPQAAYAQQEADLRQINLWRLSKLAKRDGVNAWNTDPSYDSTFSFRVYKQYPSHPSWKVYLVGKRGIGEQRRYIYRIPESLERGIDPILYAQALYFRRPEQPEMPYPIATSYGIFLPVPWTQDADRALRERELQCAEFIAGESEITADYFHLPPQFSIATAEMVVEELTSVFPLTEDKKEIQYPIVT